MRSFYNQFKTPIVTIILICLSLFLYTKLAGPIPFSVNSVNTTKTDLFTTSGEGKATAVPDQATVNAGVTQQAATVADAQNKVNLQTQKIISGIMKLGISEKDIKTTNYSVNPNYSEGGVMPMMYPIKDSGTNITSYTVTQNLEINVKDLTKVNKVIDSATGNGANMINGTNFTFSDELQQSLEQKARLEAVNKAKSKAQRLANAAGIRLGRVVNVVENSNFPRPYAMMAGTSKLDSAVAIPETNVTPGENTITIDVSIYYETY